MKEIAPCGMNCSLCSSYQRKKNTCPGCGDLDVGKPGTRVVCRIKRCERLEQTESGFCYACEKFPCRRLKELDTRYRTRYGMSMIENLRAIEAGGIDSFLESEIEKWTCGACGRLLCVHRDACQNCGSRNVRYVGTRAQ